MSEHGGSVQEFQPHGTYRIERDGRILKVFAAETANREMMEAYAREINEQVSALEGQPFATYLEFLTDAVLIDEAMYRLRENVAERKAMGLCAAALNVSRTSAPFLISAQMGAVYENAGLPCRQFDAYDAAAAWLNQQIEAVTG
ncbi:hypothetical protein NUH88_12580 [Nisaea acidiphila]|uniref:Uncharacterized protein n=1 Tax=Nisaea acidiphila TaxID=1862145 RepID=A0A9J7AKS2_9PROT|nr:hypothetical protein [Nisaea acidiphila]UUX48251.1 hypothetical protein NUH88_12580 [Nisaea acidiphila]